MVLSKHVDFTVVLAVPAGHCLGDLTCFACGFMLPFKIWAIILTVSGVTAGRRVVVFKRAFADIDFQPSPSRARGLLWH